MKTMTIVGRVTRDAKIEKRNVGGQQVSVCNFNIAINTLTRKKDANGKRISEAEFYQVTLWRNQAESMAPYLYKGRTVAVSGTFTLELRTSMKTNTVYPIAHFSSPTIELEDKNKRVDEPAPAVDDTPVEEEEEEFDPEEDELPFN